MTADTDTVKTSAAPMRWGLMLADLAAELVVPAPTQQAPTRRHMAPSRGDADAARQPNRQRRDRGE